MARADNHTDIANLWANTPTDMESLSAKDLRQPANGNQNASPLSQHASAANAVNLAINKKQTPFFNGAMVMYSVVWSGSVRLGGGEGGGGTSGFHQPDRHCLRQARSAVRCSASGVKGELRPSENHSCDGLRHLVPTFLLMDDNAN